MMQYHMKDMLSRHRSNR